MAERGQIFQPPGRLGRLRSTIGWVHFWENFHHKIPSGRVYGYQIMRRIQSVAQALTLPPLPG